MATAIEIKKNKTEVYQHRQFTFMIVSKLIPTDNIHILQDFFQENSIAPLFRIQCYEMLCIY